MNSIDKRKILINASIAVMAIPELEIKERLFNDIIKNHGIDELYIFEQGRNRWVKMA